MRRGEITVAEAAERLQVHPMSVFTMVSRGTLESRKTRHRRYIKERSVHELLERREAPKVNLNRARARLREQVLAEMRAGREAAADAAVWRAILSSRFSITEAS